MFFENRVCLFSFFLETFGESCWKLDNPEEKTRKYLKITFKKNEKTLHLLGRGTAEAQVPALEARRATSKAIRSNGQVKRSAPR